MISSNYEFLNFVDLTFPEKQIILDWLNHIEIRKWGYNKNIVSIEEHLSFIESLRTNEHKKYWAVRADNKFIGVSSIVNINNNIGEWGYYLAPELHEENIGLEFCYNCLKHLFYNIGLDKVVGYVMCINDKAVAINNFLGFTETYKIVNINNVDYNFFYIELLKKDFEKPIKLNQEQKINSLSISKIVFDTVKDYLDINDIFCDLNEATVLIGSNAIIDSIGLVNIIVDIESELSENNIFISLTSERAMSRKISPFRNIKSIVNFIEEYINE